jgi:hypothetical protein
MGLPFTFHLPLLEKPIEEQKRTASPTQISRCLLIRGAVLRVELTVPHTMLLDESITYSARVCNRERVNTRMGMEGGGKQRRTFAKHGVALENLVVPDHDITLELYSLPSKIDFGDNSGDFPFSKD